jgi:acyl CoA:acetate/3-ketoacid CoA transferase alpha subunit
MLVHLFYYHSCLLSRGRTADVSDMQTVTLERAVAMIPDGASLVIGGFMATGTPERVVDELVRQNKRNLTVIANDTASHIGLNPETQRQMTAGVAYDRLAHQLGGDQLPDSTPSWR